MTLLHWRPSMSVGVDAIDADHKHLIDLLNRLHYTAVAGDDAAAVGEILDELVTYARVHFAREEALMRRTGYPELRAHRQRHARLADRLHTFRAVFEARPQSFDVPAFYDFLSDWLLVHVLEEDMKITQWLQKHPQDLAHAP